MTLCILPKEPWEREEPNDYKIKSSATSKVIFLKSIYKVEVLLKPKLLCSLIANFFYSDSVVVDMLLIMS